MQTNTTYQNKIIQNYQSSFSNISQEQFSIEESLVSLPTTDNIKRAFDGTLNSSTQSDADVTQFLDTLRTKGAAKFLADLNKEKIEKLVNEYKQKLLDKMGDSPEAMQEIAKMIADYKKQLLEELQNSLDNDDKKTLPINANSIAQLLLNTQEKQTKPLEKLLQLKN